MLPILICKAINKSSHKVAKAVRSALAEHRQRTRLSAAPHSGVQNIVPQCTKGTRLDRRALSSSPSAEHSIIDARVAVAIDVAEPCFLLLLLLTPTPSSSWTSAWACLWAVSVSVSVLVFATHSSRTVAVNVTVAIAVVNALFSQCVHKKFKIQLENTHVAKC